MTSTTMRRRRVTGLGGAALSALVGGLLTGGCGDAERPTAGDIRVISTTTMLGDVVGQVVTCAGGKAETLMPIGADPHEYAPSSAAVTRMLKADLVVANGLDLEEGLGDAIASVEKDGGRVFEVAPKLDPIPFGQAPGEEHTAGGEPGASEHPAGEHGDDGHHAAGSPDPHFWQDVARMAKAARLVGTELSEISADTGAFERCGAKVGDELDAVDAAVRATLAGVPAERRMLITDHHAFGYFAAAYGFRVAGVVVPGGSTLAAPSSGEVAKLVAVIRDHRIPAIFSNAALSSDLVKTIARETGSQVKVVPLFVGSLSGKEGEAGTYRAMVQTNAKRITEALSG